MDMITLLLGGIFLFSLLLIKNKVDFLEKRVSILEDAKEKSIRPLCEAPVTTFEQTEGSSHEKHHDTSPNNASDLSEARDILIDPIGWVRRDWPMKFGVLLVILAITWFVTYAFKHNWIGPMERVSLGIVFGAIVLALGSLRFNKNSVQGSVLMLVGSSSLLVALFAGSSVYNFFPSLLALLLMFAVCAYLGIFSYYKNKQKLAIISILTAGALPLFFEPSLSSDMAMGYGFVLCSAILLFAHNRWERLSFVAILIAIFYVLTYGDRGFPETEFRHVVFGFLLTGMFLLVCARSFARSGNAQERVLFISMTGLFFLMWMLVGSSGYMRYIGLFLGSAFFTLFGIFMARFVASWHSFGASVAVSAVLFTSGSMFAWEGNTLATALIIQMSFFVTMLLVVLRNRETHFDLIRFSTFFLVMAPILLSLPAFVKLFGYTPLDSTFLVDSTNPAVGNVETIAIFFLVFVALSFLAYYTRNSNDARNQELPVAFGWISSAYALALFWHFLHVLIHNAYAANMVFLITLTVIGLIFYLLGSVKNKMSTTIAFILFGVVLSRLLLVEIWTMSVFFRIITFFVIGVLFVSTVFLKKRS